jgi:hypothetical protein
VTMSGPGWWSLSRPSNLPQTQATSRSHFDAATDAFVERTAV